MIARRLHAVVTVALALGVAYFGSSYYFGADRVQAPAETRRGDGSASPGAVRLAHAGAEETSGKVGVPGISGALLRQALSAIGSGEQQPPEAARSGSLAQARATLDERLLGESHDRERVARLEHAIRPLLTPTLLGETVAELRCGDTMCRVNLIGEDDARVNGASNAFAEHLPKTFSATVVYPDGAGHRSVYLSTSADDLKLEDEPPAPLEVVEHDATTAR